MITLQLFRRCYKHAHQSRGAAEAHLRSLERRGMANEKRVAYPCGLCGYWHVGRRKKSSKY